LKEIKDSQKWDAKECLGGHSLGAVVSSSIFAGCVGTPPKGIEKDPTNLRDSKLQFGLINGSKDGFYFESKRAKQCFLNRFPPENEPNRAGGSLFHHEIKGGNRRVR